METMNPAPEGSPAGIHINDILGLIFKHKWKILLCSLAGLTAAVWVSLSQKSTYESQAKILVRYVIDTSAIDGMDGKMPAMNGTSAESAINTETEILKSRDLALSVAEAITPERVLPHFPGQATKYDAAAAISGGLAVSVNPGSKVILVSYTAETPELASMVLAELVNRYMVMHLEIHRSNGAFEYLTQQSDQMRSRLAQTDEQLRELKAKAGITSLVGGAETLSSRLRKLQEELLAAEASEAEQRAAVLDMQNTFGGGAGNAAVAPTKEASGASSKTAPAALGPEPNSDELQRYRVLLVRLEVMRRDQLDLEGKYTPENRLVSLNRREILDLEKQRRDLEARFPKIAAAASGVQGPQGPQGPQGDFLIARSRLQGIEARIATLKSQIQETEKMIGTLSANTPAIAQLERRKEFEEENSKYLASSLERARVDETLNPARMPNISIVQKPTPGALTLSKNLRKLVYALGAGGFGIGLGLVALLELVMDRTIKQPLELESRFRIPMLIAIPMEKETSAPQMLPSRGQVTGEPQDSKALAVAPWEPSHFMRPYAEAMRDRLALEFKLKGLSHKPKLVAVAGCDGGEGVSTIAAGLAVALSDTGDGKVLLVDMNAREAQAHPFFEGRPTSSLSDVIEGGAVMNSAGKNLYLAVPPAGNGSSSFVPTRFYDLLPHLKATDFDFVIFDMPPLAENSVSLAMSCFMDKVVVVVEAERTSREFMKRSYDELKAVGANVCTVVNKTRTHGPKWLAA